MKHGKRAAALLVVFVLVTVLTATAYAAESSYNVWIEAVPDSGTGTTLTIPVKSDGTATDGLAVITYDPDVLQVSEENVSKAGVDMYSANVTEPGTLKISWIVGDTPAAGDLVNVNFQVLKQNADPGLGMNGEAYGPETVESASKSVGAVPVSSSTTPSSPEPGGSEKPAPGGSKPSTGDESNLVLWIVIASVCMAGALVCVMCLKKSKSK